MGIAARNTKELQVGYLVTTGTRTARYSIYFYTNAHVPMPFVTFYDAKLQLVNTPVEGKPCTISLNHTCQCSLLTLSCNRSPSHFFPLHTTFKFLFTSERLWQLVKDRIKRKIRSLCTYPAFVVIVIITAILHLVYS